MQESHPATEPFALQLQATAPPPAAVQHSEPGTDGMAIAGFVLAMCSLVTFFLFIPPILGVIFSAIGLNHTKEDRSTMRVNSKRGATAVSCSRPLIACL
jgi:hypothetical protein